MRNRFVVLVVTVLAVGASALPARAVDRTPDGGVGRQATVTVTIDGRGFGHGKGLSQYGALGRAKAGHGYARIVEHYYPGTRWGTASGSLKVLITGDTSSDLVVGPRSGLTVRSLGSGRTWTLPARRDGAAVKRWRITPASGERSAVSYRTGSWHVWRKVAGDAQFAAGGSPIRLYTPSGGFQYRGTLRSVSPTSSATRRDTVNILSLESYLRGVVPREVPALWSPAAVRAQAVAARTYAAFERAQHQDRYYHLCDTAHCQVYGGFGAEHPASDAAVQATARRVVTFGGSPAFTQFSASNGGYSVAGDFPYLVAKPDPYDDYQPWSATFTGDQIARNWPNMGDLVSITVDERDGRGAFGGRVLSLTVTMTKGSVSVSGDTFRSFLGLRSTLIADPVTSP